MNPPRPWTPALLGLGLALLGTRAGAADEEFALGVRTTEPQAPELQRNAFRVPQGFEVQLVAAEPDINKPMNLAFDATGRLWVTTSIEYPFPAKDRPGRDRLMIFSDFGEDGRARRVVEFADGLNIPIGIHPFRGGDGHWRALVWSIPNIWLLEDTDDDGRADRRTVMYGPFDHTRDTHGNQASFRRGFDGWLYATHGFNNDSHVTARDGSHVDLNSGNTYRIRLDGTRIEQHTHGQVNPFGLAWDARGNLYSSDCHSAPIYQLLAGGWYPSFGKPHDGLGFAPVMLEHAHGSTAIDGAFYYEDDLWPREYRDTFLIGNVMTSRLNRDRIEFVGSTPRAVEQPDFLTTTDPWFRPVDTALGPDGALYVADFYNRIIGHYEVPLTHPGRDRERGRIWRVIHRADDGKPRLRPPALAADPAGLVAELGSPNLTRRLLAMEELQDRFGGAAIGSIRAAVAAPVNAWQRVHALWLLRRLGDLRPDEIADAGNAADPLVRTHAQRIAADVLDRARRQPPGTPDLIPAAVALARAGLSDADALVRRCAAEALGHRPDPAQVDPLLDLLARTDPADTHLVYGVRRALREHLADDVTGRAIATGTGREAGARRALAGVALAVPTAPAATFLLREVASGSGEGLPPIPEILRHAARHAPADELPRLAAIARERFPGQPDFQLELFRAVDEGLRQRGLDLPTALREWGGEVAGRLLEDHPDAHWVAVPTEGSPAPGPWDFQERRTTDGRILRVLSSLPGGEQRTGILQSPAFSAGDRITFWLCGHDGYPDKPAGHRNRVRLRRVSDNRILFEAAPPRNDTAHVVAWDTRALRGERVVLELVDGDTGDAYAWLAIGDITGAPPLPAVSPRAQTGRLTGAADLAGRLGLRRTLPQLRALVTGSAEPEVAAAAARSLITLDPDGGTAETVRVLADAATPEAVRERLGTVLAEQPVPAAQAAVAAALKTVPYRVQQRWGESLTGSRAGSETFLRAVESGAASPRLLQGAGLRNRLQATGPDGWQARVERLTADLPPPDGERERLLEARRAAFGRDAGDPEAGKAVFQQNCAACHRIGSEGGLVGPQLTGIGNRGVERLCEDILDPNRNVDSAFRQTLLTLDDGEVVGGLVRRDEGELVILANAAGGEFSVPRNRIRARAEIEQSLMPENFGDSVAPKDFNNLLAYLLGQRDRTGSPDARRSP